MQIKSYINRESISNQVQEPGEANHQKKCIE